MMKIFGKIIVLIVLFISIWQMLALVPWTKTLGLEEARVSTEEKLGDLIWQQYKDRENREPALTEPAHQILSIICKANHIETENIKLHVIDDIEVNAFAMPGQSIIVNRGLLEETQDPGELAGVIAHELAHLQHNHVMKKLLREFGLSVLTSVASGRGGGQTAEVMKILGATAYDRKFEKEADLSAVEYMVAAGVSPEHLANFLYRLGKADGNQEKYLRWIRTHPDSGERAAYILDHARKQQQNIRPLLADSSWQQMKNALELEAEED